MNNKLNSDTCRCNFNCWPNLARTKNHISESQMFFFLYTIRKICNNDAEFTEACNQALFDIIQLNPELFLRIINKYKTVFDFDYILFTLENPVNEDIDLKKVLKMIKAVNGFDSTKNEIINSLQKAIDKYKFTGANISLTATMLTQSC